MTTVLQGSIATPLLPPGSVLTVVTGVDSSAYVLRLAASAGGANKSFNSMISSETLTFGPYQTVEHFNIKCLGGSLTVSSAEYDTSLAPTYTIPTVDPEVVGEVWNDAGTLKVSEGP